ncbi:Yip1 family protein [Zavarzinia sp. CC-PAN008]|uniref:Yip1 family protein n=1 Tax=Zavarzinia sp. CC-PAN008 TaxID=3243332 RepID=UPI003F744D62
MALVERVRNILTNPKAEWPIIAGEPRDMAGLYAGYIIPLAAIPTIAGLVGSVVFGGAGLFSALMQAVLGFVLGLVLLYGISLVAGKLAPSFGGVDDHPQALKLIAYAQTPVWLAGIVLLVPMLAVVQLIAVVYYIYLLWVGIPTLLRVPPDRRLPFLLLLFVLVILALFLVGYIVGLVFVGSHMG